MEHVLEWLNWVLPLLLGIEDPNDAVVVLDWFAPHLDPAVVECCKAHGVKLLLFGGGITGEVQVADTHKHNSYQ